MLLILLYPGDVRVDAILLAANRSHMRVILRGCDDTIEFRLKNKKLISADGCVVEIESALPARGLKITWSSGPSVAHAA